jgi:predicted nucleotidyltransferase
MHYGLKKETVKKIRSIFARYTEIDSALLYGSRAKGNFRPGSDIDLTLVGEDLHLQLLNKISLNLDDLLLPYTIDLSIYSNIANPDLIDHIARVGKVFYQKPEKKEGLS